MTATTACPLHGLPLDRRTVPVAYGLFYYPDGYEEARERGFPHGGEPPGGGCVVPKVPGTAIVEVCARCAEARTEWWRANDRLG